MAYQQDLRTELYTGSWQDISTYVYQRDLIQIQRGRPNEASTMSPGSATLTLNNRDGRFTTRNPVGAYYPNLVQNSPLRLSVKAADAGLSNYLRLESDLTSSATTPDKVALQITGPIDVRVDCWLSDYQPAVLAAKWGGTAQSWAFVLGATGTRGAGGQLLDFSGTGTLGFYWFDGSSIQNLQANIPLPYYGQRIALRVVFTPATGVATFYTAATMAGSWTQLGAVQTFGATTLSNGAGQAVQTGGGPLSLPVTGVGGGSQFFCTFNSTLGMIFETQLLSNVTVVADPVFSSQTAGVGSFADAQANTWTLTGTAAVTDRLYRFHGEMGSYPHAADPSGQDIYSQASAFGVSRRLQNSNTPGYSPFRRARVRNGASVALGAYWPCEDGQGATSLGSALGGPAMTISSGPPALSSNSSFACSNPLPVMNGAYFYGQVPQGYAVTDAAIRFLWAVPAGGETNGATILQAYYTGGAVGYSTLVYGTGGTLNWTIYNPAGTVIHTTGALAFGVNGLNLLVTLELKKNAGNIDMTVAVLPVNSNITSINTTTAVVAGAVPSVQAIEAGGGGVPLTTSAMGHFSVQGIADNFFTLAGALSAWAGEPAATRYARICAEESIACRIVGNPLASAPMAVQTADTVFSLLRACENTDLGMMFEPRSALGVGYRTRSSMYHQAPQCTASYSAGQVFQGFASTGDTQLAVNDVTAQAADGATARQQLLTGTMSVQAPPAGISRIDTQIQPSPQYDATLNQLASWYLWTRSVDDDRYPAIPFEMARTETPVAAALLDVGDYLQITGTPSWLPPGPVRQLVAGISETLFPASVWTLDVNGIPEAPYETAQIGTAHLQTSGAQLTSSVTAGATTFQVTTTTGPVWTQAGGDFPFDILVDGERMTVTAITSATSPQTFTVTRAVNGVTKAHNAAAQVTVYNRPVLAL